MLMLSAILGVRAPREPEPNELLAAARGRLGFLGLSIIALVFVLTRYWQG
jgi:hypothetical protein